MTKIRVNSIEIDPAYRDLCSDWQYPSGCTQKSWILI